MRDIVLHLIPNAHLDPVWLWDWREGLNEGLTTCRTILDLMDEDDELTFIRGETAIYEHIGRTDAPAMRLRVFTRPGTGCCSTAFTTLFPAPRLSARLTSSSHGSGGVTMRRSKPSLRL